MAIRVLVVDDSSFFRRRVSEILTADGDIEVVATAADGAEAVAQAEAVRPDVITMDIEMPVLDGISAVRQIMDQSPTPILMFSSLTHSGAQATLDALEAGALDFLPKKFEDIARNREDATNILQQRVKALAHKRVARIAASPVQPVPPVQSGGASDRFTARSRLSDTSRPRLGTATNSAARPSPSARTPLSRGPHMPQTGEGPTRTMDRSQYGSKPDRPASVPGSTRSGTHPERTSLTRQSQRDTFGRSSMRELSGGQANEQALPGSAELNPNSRYKLLAIGTSTGGPVALQTILTQLPANFPYPIVLVQHMPATFTNAFAQRLDGLCQISVKEAQDGDVLQPGVAYLAPGGTQMLADGRSAQARLRIRSDDDDRITYRPSVDLTFASLSKVYGGQVLGIILTGMGADGREGCRMLRAAGATVWAQDKDSCVVYGMPQAVAAAGISSKDIPLAQMAHQIMTEVGYASS